MFKIAPDRGAAAGLWTEIEMSKLTSAIVISWLVGVVCGYGLVQVFDTGCDNPTSVDQPAQ